jgi:GntR family histidine utilization transcriptional repressor
LALLTLHEADDAPYCLEDRLINVGAIPEAVDVDFSAEPAGNWLLRKVPWGTAEHVIRAVAATSQDAKLLKVPAGSPCLEIDRITTREGSPLTAVRICYPGDQHQMVARFMPGS